MIGFARHREPNCRGDSSLDSSPPSAAKRRRKRCQNQPLLGAFHCLLRPDKRFWHHDGDHLPAGA